MLDYFDTPKQIISSTRKHQVKTRQDWNSIITRPHLNNIVDLPPIGDSSHKKTSKYKNSEL